MSSLRIQGWRKYPQEWTQCATLIIMQLCQCEFSYFSTPTEIRYLCKAPIIREPIIVRQKYQQSLLKVLVATHPAAAPASKLLMPSSRYLILRRMHLTNLSVSTVAHMQMVIVRYWGFKLFLKFPEPLIIILRLRMSWSTPEMIRPYLRFLRVCLMTDMMHPCQCAQKGVFELTISEMKFIVYIQAYSGTYYQYQTK